MKTYQFTIQNLKCGGCASTITKKLDALENVHSVEVNIEESRVTFSGNEDSAAKVRVALDNAGYPLDEEMNSTIKKAKSYVSCMVGRMAN